MRLNPFKHAFDRFPHRDGIARNCPEGRISEHSGGTCSSTPLRHVGRCRLFLRFPCPRQYFDIGAIIMVTDPRIIDQVKEAQKRMFRIALDPMRYGLTLKAIKCVDYLTTYTAARDPDSEAGEALGPNETERLGGKVADIRGAA